MMNKIKTFVAVEIDDTRGDGDKGPVIIQFQTQKNKNETMNNKFHLLTTCLKNNS